MKDLINEALNMHYDYIIKGVKMQTLSDMIYKLDSALNSLGDSLVDKSLIEQLVDLDCTLKKDKFRLTAGYIFEEDGKENN